MQDEQFELHADIEERHWWFLGRRQIVRSLLARAVPPSAKTLVIDVGCGTGANIASLADAYRCIGIDTSARAVELARQRFPQVRFVHGRVPEDLKGELRQAKVVLLMDVLEHIAEDTQFFSRLVSKLSPGAHVLVTVPADQSLWSPHDVAFGHYRRYDREQLLQVWDGLPMTTRLISYFNSRLLPVIRGVRNVNRLRNRASGAAGTDFNLPAAPINRTLKNFFAGETRVLNRAFDSDSYSGYRRGASLVAILRQEAAILPMHQRPAAATANAPDVARAA